MWVPRIQASNSVIRSDEIVHYTNIHKKYSYQVEKNMTRVTDAT